MDIMKDLERAELRSEKVRNIMMESPPIVIRYGTVSIAILLLAIVIIVFAILS